MTLYFPFLRVSSARTSGPATEQRTKGQDNKGERRWGGLWAPEWTKQAVAEEWRAMRAMNV